MMLTILRPRFFALTIIIYIHSFIFFIALAAPVLVSSETPSVLRRREPHHGDGLYVRENVHSWDNKVPDVRARAPAASYLTRRNPLKSQHAFAWAGREPETLSRRSFFSSIGNAFKKVGEGIKNVAQKVGNGIKTAAQTVGNGVKQAAQKVGNGIKTAAQTVGNGVKNAAQKVGNGIKNAAQKVGNGIKTAAQKVGNGIKTAAQKVGNGVKSAVKTVGNGLKTAGKWVKDNGAKIAKAGLKIASTVGSVAGRVANFVPIPGLNKMMSKGLKYASYALDKGSDAIKADLGGFGKAMNVMDKIQHPLSGVGGEVLDAVLKRDVDGELVIRQDFGGIIELEEREFDFEDLVL